MTPKRLPRVDIREVHFDERDFDRGERVAQGDASVRQSSRVHDNPRNSLFLGGVDALDQGPLLVTLERLQNDPALSRRGDQANP